jgi:hypothetical protein
MKLKVNRKTIEIFEGALVRHALLRYFAVKGLDVRQVDTLTVTDRWGHEIDLDAPASQHSTITFRVKSEK